MARQQWALAFASIFEAATGLALITAPALLTQLVLGAPLDSGAFLIAKIAGLALISLAIACWPRTPEHPHGAYQAMLVYNAVAALLLLNAGIAKTASGILLWPIGILHLGLAAVFAITVLGTRNPAAT